MELATLLYSAEQIRGRVAEIGAAISRDYSGREPVLISVLKGASVFHADLLRALSVRASVDFMSISPYGASAPGVVKIVKDLDEDIGGRDVIVVEDIVDTGLTLTYLLSTLRERAPTSLEVCALLDKAARRITPVDVRYRGFECPDRFVIGYGLDFSGLYRNLPEILAVDDLDRLAREPHALLHRLAGPAPAA